MKTISVTDDHTESEHIKVFENIEDKFNEIYVHIVELNLDVIFKLKNLFILKQLILRSEALKVFLHIITEEGDVMNYLLHGNILNVNVSLCSDFIRF